LEEHKLPSSAGLKGKPSKKQTARRAGFLLDLLFNSEYEDSKFVGEFVRNYTA
jgi:hypothetical protein